MTFVFLFLSCLVDFLRPGSSLLLVKVKVGPNLNCAEVGSFMVVPGRSVQQKIDSGSQDCQQSYRTYSSLCIQKSSIAWILIGSSSNAPPGGWKLPASASAYRSATAEWSGDLFHQVECRKGLCTHSGRECDLMCWQDGGVHNTVENQISGKALNCYKQIRAFFKNSPTQGSSLKEVCDIIWIYIYVDSNRGFVKESCRGVPTEIMLS